MQSESMISERIVLSIQSMVPDLTIKVSTETPLIGQDGILTSMKLVELSLMLEDIAAELGFNFDWTSDSAMSRSRSMFLTAGSLVEEFLRQKDILK